MRNALNLMPAFQAQFRSVIASVAEIAGTGAAKSSIPEEMTFRQWCDDLAGKGMKIDGKPFRLDDRPALIPVYDAIPTTAAEAAGRIIVVQKATQLGLTVWEILAHIYMALKFGPITIGMFLPDQSTAGFKSEHRFMRIVRSVPELLRQLIYRVDGEGSDRRIGEGNVLTRVMGESLFLFLWTTGKVTTESRPMDIVGLDEVQEMALDHIDKVMARMGDSHIQFTLMLSTANMPEADINFWYALGTQEVWHTRCPHCGAMSDLADPAGIFPDKSIAYNNGQFEGATINEYVWTCPACAGWIEDPQLGELIALAPANGPSIRSFLLPRTISPRMTPRAMIDGWNRAKTGHQKKSFYNRTLARPYIDADQLPVTMAHCLACVEEGRRAGVAWLTKARDTYMGIDQMGGFHAIIIKRRLPDGRQATVHVEAVFLDPTTEDPDASPWRRSAELMSQYGVTVCVVEQLPNVDAARSFCNRFPGRAFMAGYADLKDDHMVWGDDLSRSDRRTSKEDRSRYTVTLNQYRCMQTSLFRIRERFCLFPDPSRLEQDVVENGRRERVMLLRDWVFVHFTKTALIIEHEGDETSTRSTRTKRSGMAIARKTRAKVAKVGIDPHFSYANMLCDVAWARAHGTSTFILPEAPTVPDKQQKIAEAMPGLPSGVLGMVQDVPEGTCGRCEAFDPDRDYCRERNFNVRARDPACPVYVPKG